MVRVGLTTPKVRERVNHVFRFGGGEKRCLKEEGAARSGVNVTFPPNFG